MLQPCLYVWYATEIILQNSGSCGLGWFTMAEDHPFYWSPRLWLYRGCTDGPFVEKNTRASCEDHDIQGRIIATKHADAFSVAFWRRQTKKPRFPHYIWALKLLSKLRHSLCVQCTQLTENGCVQWKTIDFHHHQTSPKITETSLYLYRVVSSLCTKLY